MEFFGIPSIWRDRTAASRVSGGASFFKPGKTEGRVYGPTGLCDPYIFFPAEHPNLDKGGIWVKNTGKSLVTGALAGVANGLFGSGGGLFLVPLFTKWLKMDQRKAFATSVAVILPLSAVSLVVFLFRGSLDFWGALPYLIGGLLGGLISGRVFKKVPVTLLRRVFGILILYGGVKALFLL